MNYAEFGRGYASPAFGFTVHGAVPDDAQARPAVRSFVAAPFRERLIAVCP